MSKLECYKKRFVTFRYIQKFSEGFRRFRAFPNTSEDFQKCSKKSSKIVGRSFWELSDISDFFSKTSENFWRLPRVSEDLTLFRLGREGGGGGGGKCPRRFQLSRTSLIFKQYLLNVASFTSIYWGTRFWKNFASRVSHVAMATAFSTPCLLNFWIFKYFSSLIDKIFKTRANFSRKVN